MDQNWQDWRRGVDFQLADLTVKVADLTVKVAVVTRDLRWIGGAILLLLTAQTGAGLSR